MDVQRAAEVICEAKPRLRPLTLLLCGPLTRKRRNRAVNALRVAKRTFFNSLSTTVKTPKQFWLAYNSLLPNRQHIPALLTDGVVTAESTVGKCNLLNSYFAKVFTNSSPYQTGYRVH